MQKDTQKEERMKRKIEFARLAKLLNLKRKVVAEIVHASEPQVKGWLDGIGGAEAYVEKGIENTININTPGEQEVEALREFVLNVARKALQDARSLESENPFSKDEFSAANRMQIDGRIMVTAEVSGREKNEFLKIDIQGRVGVLGTVFFPIDRKLGSTTDGVFMPDLQACKDLAQAAFEHAWSQYRTWMNKGSAKKRSEVEEFLFQKTRYRNFLEVFGLTADDMALMAGLRSQEDVEARNEKGLSVTRGWAEYKRPVFPPEGVLDVLQSEFFSWANNLIHIYEVEVATLNRPVGLVLPALSTSNLRERMEFVSRDEIEISRNLMPLASRTLKQILATDGNPGAKYSIYPDS